MVASARTRLKARILPRWPASINGGDLIDVDRSGSTLTISFSIEALNVAASPTAAWRLPIFDPANGVYRYITAGSLAAVGTITLSQIGDMSADARIFNAAANFTAMRTSLGAAPTIHTHAAADITDSGAFGRSMLAQGNATTATALLNLVSTGAKGLCPQLSNLTGQFLNGQGGWSVPAFAAQKAGGAIGSQSTLNFIDGGGVTFTVINDTANARINVTGGWSGVAVQAAGAGVGTRGSLNFVNGTGTTAGATDDSSNGRVNVAFNWNGLSVARNSGGTISTRRRLNLIEGANVTISVADDGANDEIDVTIASSAGSLPPGMIVPYAGNNAPAGWQICTGQSISRTTYAALFAAIGTTYGAGDGSTTFTLPDLRGRVIAGVDSMGGVSAGRITAAGSGIAGATLGATGGFETHTLSISEMPSHVHTIQAQLTGAFQAGGNRDLNGSGSTYQTDNAGGSGAHRNVQPTMMLNYIIKE